MKTIKEWLVYTLPNEISEKAIKNSTESMLNVETPSFNSAMSGIFLWDKTSEGHEYWSCVYKKYSINE